MTDSQQGPRVFYDSDADRTRLKDRTFAIIGYGKVEPRSSLASGRVAGHGRRPRRWGSMFVLSLMLRVRRVPS